MPYFSPNYFVARNKILNLVKNTNAVAKSFQHPRFLMDGSPLWLDLIQLGKPTADVCLVFLSAVHGVEGFCGSACQNYILENQHLFRDIGCLIIHAVNPYGYANLSRTNEDNIDLNRHFVDFTKPVPPNPIYAKIADFFLPKIWGENYFSQLIQQIKAIFPEDTLENIQKNIYRGQFAWDKGIFYGGSAPSWSKIIIEEIFKAISPNKRHIICIDIHSGLGSYGIPSLIHCRSDANSLQRAKQWFAHDLTSWEEENAVSSYFDGKLLIGLARQFNNIAMTNFTLEFGSRPKQVTLHAILTDNWLRSKEINPKNQEYKKLQHIVKDAFAPEEEQWQQQVISNFDYFLKKITTVAHSL